MLNFIAVVQFFLHLSFLLLLLVFFFSCDVVGTAINGYTVVVVKERAANTLRTAPDGVLFSIPPYFARLSPNWVVLERSQLDDGATGDTEDGLLHCRLPFPQAAGAVALLEERYVRQHSEQTRRDIWRWLMGPTAGGVGCLYGDAEGLLTAASQWYVFCPRGKVLKVNETAVMARHKNIAASEVSKKIENLLRRSFSSGGLGLGDNLHGLTVTIGEYTEHVTQPRWNVERRVWELLYPSKRLCDASERNVSRRWAFKKHNAETKASVKGFWETVVRLYCYEKQGGHSSYHWSATELLQTCTHEIAFTSPAVCKWDRELENLRVNPIPCIAI